LGVAVDRSKQRLFRLNADKLYHNEGSTLGEKANESFVLPPPLHPTPKPLHPLLSLDQIQISARAIHNQGVRIVLKIFAIKFSIIHKPEIYPFTSLLIES
jgi:hypothetical protein